MVGDSIPICTRATGHFKAEWGREGERVETQMENDKGLVSVNVIRLVLSPRGH